VAVALFALIVAVSLGIAALTVGRAARRLAAQEPSVLFEFDEAVEFVATALPARFSSRLSYGDVRTVVAAHVATIEQRGHDDPELILIDESMIDAVAGRPDVAARSLVRDDVAAVLEAEADYLLAIGAVADPVAPDDEDEDEDRDT
jgi:hypothetical protein